MNFRNLLAILAVIVIIPGLWVTQGLGYLAMPETIIGATIMGWGLILQFYFRKKSEGEEKGV